MDILSLTVHKWNISLEIRYTIFFYYICVSVASRKRLFSKLKLIKNYLCSSISQKRLFGLARSSIKHDVGKEINFDDIINKFCGCKS